MLARRQFLAGLGAATVLGFDPAHRTWVSVAEASPSSPLDHLPPLDGVVVTDAASLAAAGTDAGSIIHRTPLAVLRPGSVRDIQKMIKFCRRFDLKVAARGQGHMTFGQAQVEGGLVVEMATLNQIHSIGPTSADVDAGVKWKDLILAAFAQGVRPPAITGYTQLSIGGTLSAGGISTSYTQGAQVDRVQELEVVTGEGDIVRCSRHQQSDLFEAVLAGLGQCGIITRAVVDMVPAKQFVRVFQLGYADNATFFRDFRKLLNRGEFRDLFNIWAPNPSGGWLYQLNAIQPFDPTDPPPDGSQLLRNLSLDPSSVPFVDVPFVPFALNVDTAIDFFKQIGLWDGVLHPWFDMFLPNESVEQYVGEVVPTLQPDDVGPTGFMLLFAQKRLKLTRPLLRVPECSDWVFLFDILTAAATPGPDAAFEARMRQRNRRLFEKARAVGGTRYPIGTVDFNRADWIIQYDGEWRDFAKAKRRFDPDGILTPGPGIF